MTGKRLVVRGMQRYWRMTRALTLGAQGCVLDNAERVLLIRHTYRPGWHFPGGGVEVSEPVEVALARELAEETGVIVDGRPQLFGLYDNQRLFRGDHIVLFVVRRWSQPSVPPANREIAEQRFFTASELPADINPATATRVAEVLEGRAPAQMW